MFDDLKRLSKETLVYGLATVVPRLLNALLVPLYTHYMLPAEYGLVAIMFSYIAFLTVLYSHAMEFAYMRFFEPNDEGRKIFSTAFWSLAITSLVFSSAVTVFASPISAVSGIPAELAELTRYAAWILAFDAVATVPFAYLRMTHRAPLFAGIKIGNIVLNLTLNIVFVARLGMGVRGVFLASVITSAATLAVLAPVYVPLLSSVFDRALHKSLLAFALPLVPASLASMMVQVIDRPILKFLTDDRTVGLYQANYRLGIVMQLVVNMFDYAWRPFFLQRAKDPQAPRLFGRVLTYWAAGGAFVVVVSSLFVGPLVTLPLFAGRPLIALDYWPGLTIVPVVLAGYLFNGVYINMLVGPTLAKKNNLVVYATALGALVNVGTNFLWIPRWGMTGAAWATFAAYFAMAVALYLMGRDLFHVEYEPARLVRVVLAGAVPLLLTNIAGIGVDRADRLLLRAGIVLSFPAALALLGFFDQEELAALKRRFGSA